MPDKGAQVAADALAVAEAPRVVDVGDERLSGPLPHAGYRREQRDLGLRAPITAKAVVLRETQFATGAAFTKLLAMIEAGRVGVLAMTRLDNLDRGLAVWCVLESLREGGGRLELPGGAAKPAGIEKAANDLIRRNVSGRLLRAARKMRWPVGKACDEN